METSLHRALKDAYARQAGARSEVVLEGFRIDAVDSGGQLIEVQSGALGPLRGKLCRLLPAYRVRVVKPVVLERRVVRRNRPDGPDLSARRSPWRGAVIDVFEDLVGLARLFPDPNLVLEVLTVSIDEVRVPRRRWPGHRVVDRRLGAVHARHLCAKADDLWRLLPAHHDWAEPFSTADLARRLERPLEFAQRVAYCLRMTGAAADGGKAGRWRLYRRPDPDARPGVRTPRRGADFRERSPA